MRYRAAALSFVCVFSQTPGLPGLLVGFLSKVGPILARGEGSHDVETIDRSPGPMPLGPSSLSQASGFSDLRLAFSV